jgi:hypothetical protein
MKLTLIDFKTLQEILSSPEWRKRWETAATYEEAEKVILNYLHEKKLAGKTEKPEGLVENKNLKSA